MIKNLTFLFLFAISNLLALESLILIGSPGSGKGTFAEVAKKNGYDHISAGDLIRDEIRKQTPLGISIEETVRKGQFIDPEVMYDLLKNRVLESIELNKPFIIDGYGRTIEDANRLKNLLEGFDTEPHVLLLVASPENCLDRMMHRLVCQSCDYISSDRFGYEIGSLCPACQNGNLERRINDEKSVIEKRISGYHETVKKAYSQFLEIYPSNTINTEKSFDECQTCYQSMIDSWKKAD